MVGVLALAGLDVEPDDVDLAAARHLFGRRLPLDAPLQLRAAVGRRLVKPPLVAVDQTAVIMVVLSPRSLPETIGSLLGSSLSTHAMLSQAGWVASCTSSRNAPAAPNVHGRIFRAALVRGRRAHLPPLYLKLGAEILSPGAQKAGSSAAVGLLRLRT